MSSGLKAGILVAVLVVFGGIAFFVSRPNDESSNVSNQQKSSVPQDTEETSFNEKPYGEEQAKLLTREQVALHNQADDCWTIIEGTVYDITSYIPRHPGGSNILSACGTDGTAFFNGQKAGQAGGTNDHGSSARSQLASYELGPISD